MRVVYEMHIFLHKTGNIPAEMEMPNLSRSKCKRAVGRGIEGAPSMDEINYKLIGIVHTPFKEPKGIPVQITIVKSIKG